MDQIANVIIWVIIIQGIFLGLTYIFSKKSKSNANKILGFFLLAFVFEALSSDFFPYNYVGNYLVGDYFGLPEVKLFFPVLFLNYILVKLDRSSKYKKYLKLNYALAVLVFCLTPVNIVLHLGFNATVREVLGVHVSENIFMTFQYLAFVLTVAAFMISIIETYRYKKLVQNELTDYGMLQINWLWQFIFILFPIILLWGFELGRIISGGTGPSDFLSITWISIRFKTKKIQKYKNKNPCYTQKV